MNFVGNIYLSQALQSKHFLSISCQKQVKHGHSVHFRLNKLKCKPVELLKGHPSPHRQLPKNSVAEQTSNPELEREIIDFFVNAAQAFGIPKSVGEIYGLFFVSETPLALDDVIEKLQISKGSASQGIRFLKSINGLNTSYQPGDRRDFYTAETSLREIANGFMKERIRPQIQKSSLRLSSFKHSSIPPHLKTQLKTLESWNKKGELMFPFVSKFLGSKGKQSVL